MERTDLHESIQVVIAIVFLGPLANIVIYAMDDNDYALYASETEA